MNEKTIVRQEKYPIILFFAAACVIFMGLYDPIFDSLLIAVLSISFVIMLVYFSFYAIEIVITEKAIIRGKRLPLFKRKHEQIILREEFKKITLQQNEKKYFEIVAQDVNGKSIVFAMVPNRQPALEECQKFESLLKSYWT